MFDGLIAYSSKGARDFENLGFPKEKIFIARNAVSSESAERLFQEISESPEIMAEWKKEHELTNLRPIVLFVGRLLSSKRIDVLIQACASLTDKCNLVIVGDGPELEILRELANRVLPSTKFLGERVGRDLALCFFAADLFVLPGLGGLAVQEAMIYGKPVIVGESDGTQEDLVQQGRNGFMIKPGDVEILHNTIFSCLEDSAKLQAMGNESRRIVTEEINLKNMVNTFILALEAGAQKKATPDFKINATQDRIE